MPQVQADGAAFLQPLAIALESFAGGHLPQPFLFNLISIVVINVVLSGDNGVLIALAVKSLPRAVRIRAITGAAACAVVLQLAMTAFAAELLRLRFLSLIGGFVLLWISVNLFHASASSRVSGTRPTSLWTAIGFIVIANLTMSTDNVLAVAAAARGNFTLLALGLGVSIPMVVFASGFLAGQMDKYPAIVYVGAAVLGKLGGEMIMTDSLVVGLFHPTPVVCGCVEAAAAISVVAAGRLLRPSLVPAPASEREPSNPSGRAE